MQTVRLRNGKDVLEPVVKVATLSLQSLMHKNPIAFYELVMLCRDPQHQLFGNTGEVLMGLSLIESNGKPRQEMCDIVLASVEGEGLEMKLVSPIAPLTQDPGSQISTVRGDLNDYDLFVVAHQIADMILKYIDDPRAKRDHLRTERRNDGANPFYNQSASGLFLEMYYSTPSSLWTPWGKFTFAGGTSYQGKGWDDLMGDILARLGATVYKPVKNTQMGTEGPVYAIHKLDDRPLPNPTELAKTSYAPYEEVKKAWEALDKKYKSLKR